MQKMKTYRFTIHSPHFLYPVYVKRDVDERHDAFADILEAVAKDAVAKWVKDFPHFFDDIEAPTFYDSLSIMVSQEV